ncbi:putative membrane protein [Labilithrix luteola]|uniref:Putative membrane protein n=2 Tax=Labilithrix luteola TaxID=1391654 RepID=A0A0K1Q510_9BACT|nr:putative membrane protein [Labilithrix luteola]
MDEDRQTSSALLLRGAAGLLFGLLALAWPGAAFVTLLLLFGIYALVDAFASASFAVAVQHRDNGATFYFIRAVVGLSAGLLAFFFPTLAVYGFSLVVGAWAISAGTAELVLAARLRREGARPWWLGAAGVLALGCGAALLLAPLTGLTGVVEMGGMIAFLALLSGVASISVATRMHGEHGAAHA